jgi:hypothetical protein
MSTGIMQLLDTMNRFPVTQYRINVDGRIETRILKSGSKEETDWTTASPAQLSTHVTGNTVVARWLERNLGWRGLLRACVGLEPIDICREPDHRAA